MNAVPVSSRPPPRTGLLLVQQPGHTLEVFAEALGLQGGMLVTIFVEADSRLARCPRTGHVWAVLEPADMLTVTRRGVRHEVEAGWTSLPAATGQLVMVCESP